MRQLIGVLEDVQVSLGLHAVHDAGFGNNDEGSGHGRYQGICRVAECCMPPLQVTERVQIRLGCLFVYVDKYDNSETALEASTSSSLSNLQ